MWGHPVPQNSHLSSPAQHWHSSSASYQTNPSGFQVVETTRPAYRQQPAQPQTTPTTELQRPPTINQVPWQPQLNPLTEELRQKDLQIAELKTQNSLLQAELERTRQELSSLRQWASRSAQPPMGTREQQVWTAAAPRGQTGSAPPYLSGTSIVQQSSRAKQEQIDAMLAQSLLDEEIMQTDSELARRLQMEEGGYGNQQNRAHQQRNRVNSVDEYQANLELQEDLGSVQLGLTPEQIQKFGFTLMPKDSPYGPFVK